jgi:hypothetical protein
LWGRGRRIRAFLEDSKGGTCQAAPANMFLSFPKIRVFWFFFLVMPPKYDSTVQECVESEKLSLIPIYRNILLQMYLPLDPGAGAEDHT